MAENENIMKQPEQGWRVNVAFMPVPQWAANPGEVLGEQGQWGLGVMGQRGLA